MLTQKHCTEGEIQQPAETYDTCRFIGVSEFPWPSPNSALQRADRDSSALHEVS